jgi:hypothetical protein
MARSQTKTKSTRKARTRRLLSRLKTRRPHRQVKSDPQLENALRFLRAGNSQRLAARSAGVSVGRFRRFIHANRLAKFKGRRWHFTDKRHRKIVAITTVGERTLAVRGFEPASRAMAHRNAVKKFAETNDVSLLVPFDGHSITDTQGNKFFLETRPNALYRMLSASGEHYEQIYRLVT